MIKTKISQMKKNYFSNAFSIKRQKIKKLCECPECDHCMVTSVLSLSFVLPNETETIIIIIIIHEAPFKVNSSIQFIWKVQTKKWWLWCYKLNMNWIFASAYHFSSFNIHPESSSVCLLLLFLFSYFILNLKFQLFELFNKFRKPQKIPLDIGRWNQQTFNTWQVLWQFFVGSLSLSLSIMCSCECSLLIGILWTLWHRTCRVRGKWMQFISFHFFLHL